MNPHLQRALILLEQRRPDLAEAELRRSLADDPDNGFAHSLLANCLCERDELGDATQEARQAISLEPDSPNSHATMAHVMFRRNRLPEARTAIRESIRLNPYEPASFAVLAAIEYALRDWPKTLAAAEEGLRIDPEEVGCNNYRAMALVALGRRDEAGATMGTVLALDPENAFSHANQGWAMLHAGESAKAKEHFREALRLEPDLEYARRGLIEAMKARNPIYALMLRYFLWMNRLSRQAQWGVVLGGVILVQILFRVREQQPDLKPFVTVLIVVYMIFALMTWLASPLFNLLLLIDRFGRHALSREQKIEAGTVGAMVGCGLTALVCWGLSELLLPDWELIHELSMLTAIYFGVLTFPVSGIFKCPSGWPRQIMVVYSLAMAAVGLAVIPIGFLNAASAIGAIQIFMWGCFLSGFVVNGLIMARVHR